jgi:hypothetical protein
LFRCDVATFVFGKFPAHPTRLELGIRQPGIFESIVMESHIGSMTDRKI